LYAQGDNPSVPPSTLPNPLFSLSEHVIELKNKFLNNQIQIHLNRIADGKEKNRLLLKNNFLRCILAPSKISQIEESEREEKEDERENDDDEEEEEGEEEEEEEGEEEERGESEEEEDEESGCDVVEDK
jgi:cobalamin biosynthesis protein CobT